mmetsp:Transcript_6466/g.15615  ORF Transcript_6466/g.15615 Transcript_6466/m.15615 type:complete len:113 (+) Transcript_6466:105-443(+)
MGPVFGDKLEKDFGVSKATGSFLGASGAGMIAATLSHPLDTMKTCMQGDVEQKTYKSLFQTFSTLYKEEGAGRFFRGWSWRTTRMICAIFLLGQCKTKLGPLLFPKYYIQEK